MEFNGGENDDHKSSYINGDNN